MYKIDKLDKVIINLLLEDGRKSASEIARHIGDISGRVVRYRIDRMLEAGNFKTSLRKFGSSETSRSGKPTFRHP